MINFDNVAETEKYLGDNNPFTTICRDCLARDDEDGKVFDFPISAGLNDPNEGFYVIYEWHPYIDGIVLLREF